MRNELKSKTIKEGLEEAREARPELNLEVTGSVEKILDEMRRIDEERLGDNYILGIVDGKPVEEATEWMIYKHNITLGLENDGQYDISFDEVDDLEIMLGKGNYDRFERVLDEVYATEVKA